MEMIVLILVLMLAVYIVAEALHFLDTVKLKRRNLATKKNDMKKKTKELIFKDRCENSSIDYHVLNRV